MQKTLLVTSILLFLWGDCVKEVKGCMELEKHTRNECPHWSYTETKNGPSAWGDLCSSYSTCKTGVQQSPINIQTTASPEVGVKQVDSSDAALVPNYFAEHGVTILNNGHTLVLSNFSDTPNTLRLPDGSIYTLAEFHFHSSSEHTLEGIMYPLELHLVHKDTSGNLAVLGFFFKEGDSSALLSEICSELNDVDEESKSVVVPLIELQKLISSPFSFYHYNGSLTTPPCTENVKWFVSTTVLTGTYDQITEIATVMGLNNRPVQPINSRAVASYTIDGENSQAPHVYSSLITATFTGLMVAFVIF